MSPPRPPSTMLKRQRHVRRIRFVSYFKRQPPKTDSTLYLGGAGGVNFYTCSIFSSSTVRILLCFLLRTHPPPKGFRSSPYRPDPQVSARPRTEGGWVQNPLLNARVATFAFKAFATMRVPLHTLSPPWRGHGPPATTATENLRSRWVSGRQDPLLGFCVNSYVFV